MIIAQPDIYGWDDQNREGSRRGKTEDSEMGRPWKIESAIMNAAPIIAAAAVKKIGLKRMAPASSSAWRSTVRRSHRSGAGGR
jgi:hypothetical protein